MNYMREVDVFYDLVVRERLSFKAVSLWHVLLHYNSKAKWGMEFSVSSTVLQNKAGLTNISFKLARKELRKNGLIEYRSAGADLPPIYRMKRFSSKYNYSSLY